MPLEISLKHVLLAGKLGGVFTVKPSSGPHKQGESLPVGLFLRCAPSSSSFENLFNYDDSFEYLLFDEHENKHPPSLMF